MKFLEKPEDLQVEVGTMAEVFWTDLKKKCENDTLSAEREIIINEHIIKLAEEKIEYHRLK